MIKEIKHILKRYNEGNSLHPILKNQLLDKIEYLASNQEHLRKVFIEVTQKYDIDFIKSIYSSDVHLSYWRGSGDYGLSLLPDSADGVHDRDEEFGLILKDFHDADEFTPTIKEKPTREELLRFPDDKEDIYEDEIYVLYNRLFHTMVSYLWQESKGYSNGLISSIVENNSIQTFIFNDFSFSDISNYSEIKELPEVRDKHFIRDLSLEEIFCRTGLYSYGFLERENSSLFYYEKGDEFYEISAKKGLITERKGKIQEYSSAQISNSKQIDGIHEYDKVKNTVSGLKPMIDQPINSGWTGKLPPKITTHNNV